MSNRSHFVILLCGLFRFRSMAPMYYRRANAAMIVYDVTRENTFEEAKEWVKGQLEEGEGGRNTGEKLN